MKSSAIATFLNGIPFQILWEMGLAWFENLSGLHDMYFRRCLVASSPVMHAHDGTLTPHRINVVKSQDRQEKATCKQSTVATSMTLCSDLGPRSGSL
jgi:hypothetical protein